MKKILVVILLLLPFCIAFIMTVFAKTKYARMEFSGEVVSVDDVAQTISLKGPDGILVYDVSEAMFDEDYGIKDIQSGDVVEIEFEEKEGKKAAIAIMLKQDASTTDIAPPVIDGPAE